MYYNSAMECVAGERLAAAIASRHPELWNTNPRLAERIEMRIMDAQRAHRQAHGGNQAAAVVSLGDTPTSSASYRPALRKLETSRLEIIGAGAFFVAGW